MVKKTLTFGSSGSIIGGEWMFVLFEWMLFNVSLLEGGL